MFARWKPAAINTRPLEWSRAAIGMALGTLFSVWLCAQVFGMPVALHLIGPLGASAVLLFAVSSGALAQPWSILGGYLADRIGRKPTLLVVAALCVGQLVWTLSREAAALLFAGLAAVLLTGWMASRLAAGPLNRLSQGAVALKPLRGDRTEGAQTLMALDEPGAIVARLHQP